MAENRIGGSSLDPEGNAAVGEQALGRVNVSSKASVDPSAFKELNTEFGKLNTYVKDFKSTLPKLISDTKAWADALGKVATNMKKVSGSGKAGGGGGGGSYIPEAGMTIGSNNTITQQQIFNYHEAAPATGGGGGGGGNEQLGLLGKIQYASNLIGPLANSVDNRIARGASYSLSADRMNMMYQQMTGLSQNQVYHTFREPLQNRLLGYGGINEVLGLQASTGINAAMQAKSVEALRAASGFAYSTSDINAMTRQLGSAQTTNQMFMMLGTGLYGIGGKQKSTQQVYQDTISRLGLTDESTLRGAFQQGSMTRARMEMAGIGEDQQDLMLKMARENVAFQKKTGGKYGFYDQANPQHRKIMGVEDSQYATQYEKTEASGVRREEDFYKRQNDNFAQMEKNLQAVNRALGAFEEKLSGLVGARVSTKGSMLKGALKWGAAALVGGVTGNVAAAFGTKALLDQAFGGDPTPAAGSSKSGPTNDYPAMGSGSNNQENVKKSEPQLAKLNPRFASRLRNMLKANPRLYIGTGQRQNTMAEFLKRYQVAPAGQKGQWNVDGKEYVLRPGYASYAPPGSSMHEIGLAADMFPSSEHDWISDHAAEFGLRNFPDMGEKWHVQPNDLPTGRKAYEEMGSPWGMQGQPKSNVQQNSVGDGGKSGGAISMGSAWSMMSMGEIIGTSMVGGGGGSGSGAYTPGKSSNSVAKAPGPDLTPTGSGTLSGPQVAQLMFNAGFRGNDLQKAIAVAYRESRFNPTSHNTSGRDNSYGLMQINMKDDDPSAPNMGKIRAARFAIKNYNELFNPTTNARSAWAIFSGNYQDGQKRSAGGWTGWDSHSLKEEYLTNAKNYIKEAKLPSGDAVAPVRQNVSGAVGAVSSYTITVAPNITIHSQAGGGFDLQKVARDVASMLEREVRMTMMRVS